VRTVLLDENLPRLLKGDLPQFDVRTVREMGWSAKSNGELLQIADENFEVLVTADRSLPNQQSLAGRRVGVVVLATRSTKLEDIREILGPLRDAIASVKPGAVAVVAGK
jgi:predicted nuclease of predicted toxin-antitoxin system